MSTALVHESAMLVVAGAYDIKHLLNEVQDHVYNRKVPRRIYEKIENAYTAYSLNIIQVIENNCDEDLEQVFYYHLDPRMGEFLNILDDNAIHSEEDVDCVINLMEEIILWFDRVGEYLP